MDASAGRFTSLTAAPPLSSAARERLTKVATATLTSVLTAKGIRTTFVAGLVPTRPDLRLVGPAFTLRYVPAREDVMARLRAGELVNAQRAAVEAVEPGQVLVIDARNEVEVASFGDILATRIHVRGAAGLVTDGALRDTAAIEALDLPVYYRAPHAASALLRHVPLECGVPISCGGVLVLPGDVVVGDAEGVVVVPAQLAEEVAAEAYEQELAEEFAVERVREGEPVAGLFPLSAERRPAFEVWRRAKEERGKEQT